MSHPDLPAEIVEAAAARRGRPHVYDRIAPERCALVVIDMQRAFVEQGAPSEVPMAREIVPAINRLAAALRQAGGQIVWGQATFDEAGGPALAGVGMDDGELLNLPPVASNAAREPER